MLGRADLALVLLPRLTGGDEDDLVEPEPGLDLGGGHEVAVVDRVERPAHHSEAHGQWWLPWWSAVRGVAVGARRGTAPCGPWPAASFWAVPRKDHRTPSRARNATNAMAPNAIGGHRQLAGVLLGDGDQVRQRQRHAATAYPPRDRPRRDHRPSPRTPRSDPVCPPMLCTGLCTTSASVHSRVWTTVWETSGRKKVRETYCGTTDPATRNLSRAPVGGSKRGNSGRPRDRSTGQPDNGRPPRPGSLGRGPRSLRADRSAGDAAEERRAR